MKKILGLVLLFSLFYGCIPILSIKKNNADNNFYKVFYIENGINQYFIKPIAYKSQNETFQIDFTFRDTLRNYSLIYANFSIYSNELIKNIDSAYFLIDKSKRYFHNIERLYVESKKKYVIRVSTQIYYQDFVLLTQKISDIYVFANQKQIIFVPTPKAKKILNKCYNTIIYNIELNRSPQK